MFTFYLASGFAEESCVIVFKVLFVIILIWIADNPLLKVTKCRQRYQLKQYATVTVVSARHVGHGYNAELRNAEYRCGMRKILETAQYFYKIKL